MKRSMIVAVVSLAALALAASASASPTHHCGRMPGRVTFASQNVSCPMAYDVTHFVSGHEWVVPFRVDGKRWVGPLKRHGGPIHGTTDFRFTSSRATVFIHLPFPAS